MVLGDDPSVKRGKPSPDIFIEAANRLAPLVDADIVDQGPFPDVLAFEDSPVGVTVRLDSVDILGSSCRRNGGHLDSRPKNRVRPVQA